MPLSALERALKGLTEVDRANNLPVGLWKKGKLLEFQKLEIQLSEKRVKEYKASIIAKQEMMKQSEDLLADKNKDLKAKKDELEKIVSETEKEEKDLLKKSADAKQSSRS